VVARTFRGRVSVLVPRFSLVGLLFVEFGTLGHSQIGTTADVYAHLTPAMLERTAARMDGVLTRRKRASGA
jgi:hypothetical protein